MVKMQKTNKQSRCRFRLFATALGRQHPSHGDMHLPLAKWTFLSPPPPLPPQMPAQNGPGGSKRLLNEGPAEFNFRHIPLNGTVQWWPA